MFIRTKLFGFCWSRQWHTSRWRDRALLIGFIANPPERHLAHGLYRYGLRIEFSLLPNFIWHQDYLYTERGRAIYQTRIVGIQSWPFQWYWHKTPCP